MCNFPHKTQVNPCVFFIFLLSVKSKSEDMVMKQSGAKVLAKISDIKHIEEYSCFTIRSSIYL